MFFHFFKKMFLLFFIIISFLHWFRRLCFSDLYGFTTQSKCVIHLCKRPVSLKLITKSHKPISFTDTIFIFNNYKINLHVNVIYIVNFLVKVAGGQKLMVKVASTCICRCNFDHISAKQTQNLSNAVQDS